MAADLKASVAQQLDKITTFLSPEDLEATLSTLKKIFDNIIQHPNDDKYRQIKLANKTFSAKVWRYPACEELMKMSGWVVENDHVRLRDDSHVHALSQFLESYHGTLQLLPTETISDAMHGDMLDAIYQGDGPRLRRLLQQCKTPACNIYFRESGSLLSCALSFKQMGIARILINEFSIDVNGINEYGTPCVFALFKAFTESEIISFVKEFSPNVDVFNSANLSLIEYAVINKCLDVVKFFVEECKVDIDTVSSEPDSFHWTPLHVAYTVDDPRIVAYLIQNGANENAVDIHGRKPIEYAGGDRIMTEQSTALICRRNIFGRKFGSDEFKCFLSFLGEGHSDREAVIRTCEKFPSLKNDGIHSNYNLETTPTMNKLNHYITDMAPSYYTIGLELDVPNRKLKVIKNDPSLADLKEKCRKMLEVWLETDTSANWKKLCAALEEPEISLCALAEQIKKTHL